MLLGISAVSIPIIIHLLNKRKFQRVIWAAMRFLKISVEQNQRRLQIEDLLLLLIRCAMLALLAVALARPAIKAATAGMFGQARVTAVLLLDNSASMSATDGVKSRFEKGKEAAESALASLPLGSSAAVILASDIADGLIPEPTIDMNLARKAVREARLSDRSSDLLPAVRGAMDVLGRHTSLRKEIFLITDGQALAWRNFQPIQRIVDQSKADVRTHLILIDAPQENNLAVTELRMTSGLPAVGRPLRFEAQVSNFGSSAASDVRVTLHIDEDPPSDEAVIDSIDPGSSKSVGLTGKLRGPGFHSATASIAADRVPADDFRTIAIRAIESVKVLLVDGDPGREARDSETFFLRYALAPVSRSEASDYFVKVNTIGAAEFDGVKLDDYDAVFVANVTDFSDAALESISGYLRHGGGLVIFPGSNMQASFYNEKLGKKWRFLPAQFVGPFGDASQDERFFTLQDKDFTHPIARLWSDPASGSPASAHFFRAYELKATDSAATTRPEGDEVGEPRTVLRFADTPKNGELAGKPAVMERSWGMGRVVQFASTADTAWNDLPTRTPGVYLPLLDRVMGAVVRRQDEGLNVRVGERFVRQMPGELIGRDAIITPPRHPADQPKDARKIEASPRTRMATLAYDQTNRSGAYDVSITAEPPVRLAFAAEPDPMESSLQTIAPEQRKTLGESAHVVSWTGAGAGAEFAAEVEKERIGTEFWMSLAIAALVLAAAETFLSQWFSESK